VGGGTYEGRFSFLLHNIEQNTTETNGGSPAYNVFDIYAPGITQQLLEITVRYNGFTVIRLADNATKTFVSGVDSAPEQAAGYDWAAYFGVYAKGGFGNSAFTSELEGTINNDNQLFEVAYLNSPTISNDGVRRSMKDPDQLRNWELVTYLDTTVVEVPEPESLVLMLLGLGLMGVAARCKNSDETTRFGTITA
jgi:hypothetical protein